MSGMQVETNAIAGKVRGICREYRLTQLDVADVLGLERKAVSAREQGRVAYTAAEVFVLAKHIGLPVGAFFGEVPATRLAVSA